MSPFEPTAANPNPNNGYVLPQPPDDSVSRLRFSPPATGDTYLAASSWNGSVRVWKINAAQGNAEAVSLTEHGAPVLDLAWSHTGQAIFCAGADNTVKRWDLASGTSVTVAAHDREVKCVADVEQNGLLATASWDKSLRYWDPRTPTGVPQGVVVLPERAYAMDVRGPLMVLALAERKLMIFDVRKPEAAFQEKFTQLKYQTRCVATWPDQMGYNVGGIEGKVSVDHVREPNAGANYVFLCHRKGGVHAINAIRFHKQSGAFLTAGSDGGLEFWDKDRKDHAPMRRFQKMNMPICDADFSDDGSMFAYAVGYDWSRGAAGRNGADGSYIVLHALEDGELQLGKGGGHSGRGRGRGGRRRGGSRR